MPIPVTYKILYNSTNITEDISKYCTSLAYTDKTEKGADEITIDLEDSEQLWQNEWYPEKGAKLSVEIIQGRSILKCGTFIIDQIDLSGSKSGGDIVSLKGLSAAINKRLRTKKSFASEGKNLRQLAQAVASDNGLTVQGTVPEIPIDRVTQWRETDLAFLNRIGQQYGALFSVRDTALVFTSIFDVEAAAAVKTVDKIQLTSYSISDKSFLTFKDARVKFFHPTQKKVITYTHADPNMVNVPIADTMELRVKAENKQQAEAITKAALHRANSLQQGGSINLPGNVLYVAGNSLELTGLGRLSGKYHITQSDHSLTKSGGYTCNLEIKRTALIAAEKQKSKPQATAVSTYPAEQNNTEENEQ